VKVSWRVDAVRNDLWVRKHGAPVQVEKQGLETGKYQHPELYGMPKENGVHHAPEPLANTVLEGKTTDQEKE
jgi:hypothetical protein